MLRDLINKRLSTFKTEVFVFLDINGIKGSGEEV